MRKIYSLLGLCQRAGKLISGEVGSQQAIQKGNAKLLLLAEDASANTKKKFHNSAAFYEIPIIEFGTKAELGRAIGEEIRAVLAVTESGFANKLKMLAEQTNTINTTGMDERYE